MSRQDKATTERFTRTLRELVKRPENKVCADCKRNDPRWASWNIGVFLCIRCSGIHRGMGTHISKVKSVDLDVWTPEQMESIQKWGNHYANLYWEAHLKAGHVPPEHKMESFIRSKYESRRWALDGPPPADPSVLDNAPAPAAPSQSAAPPPAAPQAQPTTRPTHAPTNSFSSRAPAAAPVVTTRQPQAHHQLLSSNYLNRPTGAVPVPTTQQQQQQQQATAAPPLLKAPESDLFSLDFHAPPVQSQSTSAPQEQKKDVKQDILSLFSAAPPVSAPLAGGFGQFGNQAAMWGGVQPQHQQQPQQQAQQAQQAQQSLMGGNGVGMWAASSGWTGAPAIPAQPNVWGAPPAAAAVPSIPQQQMFNTNAVWGAPVAATPAAASATDLFASFATPSQPVQKKDDVFGDIWGGFK
ncbi:ArfGap-domain-containing protein [Pholiota conissans]|uniref:ArfGap-domain-containing protein n=1 Tax=Pholiota conissans TaxID=109636 RepID=A0A9P6CQM2_9AGAR|nr:ArfGap-domain-containing protein [Pholiota conissans]